jgi:hypothetical protein
VSCCHEAGGYLEQFPDGDQGGAGGVGSGWARAHFREKDAGVAAALSQLEHLAEGALNGACGDQQSDRKADDHLDRRIVQGEVVEGFGAEDREVDTHLDDALESVHLANGRNFTMRSDVTAVRRGLVAFALSLGKCHKGIELCV